MVVRATWSRRAALLVNGVVVVLAVLHALCRRQRGHAKGKPLLGSSRAATAMSTDVVPFLKAS
jgi:hypothetical protein